MKSKDILPIEEVIEMVEIQLEDAEYKHGRTKSPKLKRSYESAVRFWKSTTHYLKSNK